MRKRKRSRTNSRFLLISWTNYDIIYSGKRHFLISRETKIFLKYSLIYNVGLVSGVQQSDSFIHTYIGIYFFSDSFPL